MARTWSTFNAPPQWGKIQGIPSDFLDGKIDFLEVRNKPAQFPPSPHGHSFNEISNIPFSIFNWSVVVPRTFEGNVYQDLGSFPVGMMTDYSVSSFSIFLIQFNLQWSPSWFANIIGSTVISATQWITGVPGDIIERSINCEFHNNAAITLTFYIGQGNGARNLYLKTSRLILIPADGAINVKIVAIG